MGIKSIEHYSDMIGKIYNMSRHDVHKVIIYKYCMTARLNLESFTTPFKMIDQAPLKAS